MDKPWWVDVMTAGVVVAWMGWTFATMQQYGPSLDLILPAMAIGLTGILLIYGQRLTYLQLGNKLILSFDRNQIPDREDGDE